MADETTGKKRQLDPTIVEGVASVKKPAPDAGDAQADSPAAGASAEKHGPEGAGGEEQPAATATEFEKNFYYSRFDRPAESRYLFSGRLVAGGMGEIHQVMDRDLLRTSVMKVLRPEYKNDGHNLQNFITEAKITGYLEHPNIIPVHEIGFSGRMGIFFTMKLARGESLRGILALIKQNNPEYRARYSIYRLVSIFRKVCDALSFAHSRDIVHLDIKPDNIIVGSFGEVLLMDWGIAKYIGNPGDEKDPARREMLSELARMTGGEKGQIKGTPSYMSPEQTLGDPAQLDRQSDVFLLGSTLYHMMTLSHPYHGRDTYEIIGKATTGDCLPARRHNPGWVIPEEICAIIERAMSINKEARYESVEEIIKDLDDFLEGRWSTQAQKTFGQGDVLMREGEAGEEAYLITRGKVQVYRERDGRRVTLGILKEGNIIGEMSLIVKGARSASVMALEHTDVIVLNKTSFAQSLKKLPAPIEKMIQSLSTRLIDANAKINPHLTQDPTYYILEQLRLICSDRIPAGKEQPGVPADQLAAEIAENLGIASQQVADVFQKAAALQVIAYNGTNVAVPDPAELSQFIKFGKMARKMSGPGLFGGPDEA